MNAWLWPIVAAYVAGTWFLVWAVCKAAARGDRPHPPRTRIAFERRRLPYAEPVPVRIRVRR